jgi:hypothetical protein
MRRRAGSWSGRSGVQPRRQLLYIVPAAADPGYPFSLDRSWLLPESVRRLFGYVFLTAVVLGFVASALAWWGVPGLTGWWTAITVVAAGLSLALLIFFWDVQLVIGVLIDLVLIGTAIMRPSWLEAILP